MKIISHIACFFFFLILSDGYLLAQTTGGKNITFSLPEISLLDLEPAGTVSMTLSKPNEAGLPIAPPTTDKSKWINYTSAIQAGGITKNITASISTTIPGIDIKLTTSNATGSGAGVLGLPTGEITLSTSAQNIIIGIGGAFTGDGPNNGHQLTFSANPIANKYGLITAQSNTQVQVIFTITAN